MFHNIYQRIYDVPLRTYDGSVLVDNEEAVESGGGGLHGRGVRRGGVVAENVRDGVEEAARGH